MSKTEPDQPTTGTRKVLGRDLRRLRQERDLGLDDLSRMTCIAATLDVPVRRLFVEGDG